MIHFSLELIDYGETLTLASSQRAYLQTPTRLKGSTGQLSTYSVWTLNTLHTH